MFAARTAELEGVSEAVVDHAYGRALRLVLIVAGLVLAYRLLTARLLRKRSVETNP